MARPHGQEDGRSATRSAGFSLTRLLQQQIEAFNQLVAQQLEVLGGCGTTAATTEPPVLTPIAPPAPSAAAVPARCITPAAALPTPPDTRAGFWERQGIKPALAPVAARPASAAAPLPSQRPMSFSLYFFGHYEAEFSADKYELVLAASRGCSRSRSRPSTSSWRSSSACSPAAARSRRPRLPRRRS